MLLAAVHKKEIEPLLSFLPFRRESDFYRYKNVVAIVANKSDSLSIAFKIARYILRFNAKIALLFGISGSLSSDLKKGEFVNVQRIKLFDGDKHPVFNPIELLNVDFLKNVTGITTFRMNFNNNFLKLFGETIDFESYFFVKAARNHNVLPVIVRVISDYNTKEEIFSIKESGFKYDVKKLSEIVLKLANIERDWLKKEIFCSTGITETLDNKKVFILKNRLSFSKRQRLYKEWLVELKKSKPKPIDLNNIFIEKGVDKKRIKIDLNSRNVYEIDDYVAVFHNLKDRSGLIFATKKGEFLRKTPPNYTPDGSEGYSILSGYNCIYDCDYCFLKGYFRSFNPLLFLNYEDFFKEIETITKKDHKAYFYLGSFFDPLAVNFSDMNEAFYGFFESLGRGMLEFRTKSDRVDRFLSLKPARNIIFAFSLSPDSIVKQYEHFTPPLKRRLNAIKKLDAANFKIGVRLDPFFVEFLKEYDEIFDFIDTIDNLHSVEVGFLRFDKNDYKNMIKKGYTRLLKGLSYKRGMYRASYSGEIVDFLKKRLNRVYFSMEY
ncbi:SPL family radical SAM protein [Hippea jasoniae]|uniref:SPL family radical SAM protein n=1 Tax=Hippea jasoniae TaxID=944479 RepID=UPI00068E7D1C|nr:hypothetical protein [Hippea jasoniae]